GVITHGRSDLSWFGTTGSGTDGNPTIVAKEWPKATLSRGQQVRFCPSADCARSAPTRNRMRRGPHGAGGRPAHALRFRAANTTASSRLSRRRMHLLSLLRLPSDTRAE